MGQATGAPLTPRCGAHAQNPGTGVRCEGKPRPPLRVRVPPLLAHPQGRSPAPAPHISREGGVWMEPKTCFVVTRLRLEQILGFRNGSGRVPDPLPGQGFPADGLRLSIVKPLPLAGGCRRNGVSGTSASWRHTASHSALCASEELTADQIKSCQ
uniref:Uncharacterized protein n=1 Tax=Molossus molossus TaxID=27622 RepID=A0A7J8I845_MOLMO|nr:hypothetical protein HJG59_010586 [Molossus molossus]